MKMVSIEDVGRHGVVKDTIARVLPPGAWTDLKNVQFRDGYVQKCDGTLVILTPSVVPYMMMACPIPYENYWLYAGLQKVYGFLGASQADITRVSGNYTGGAYDQWFGGNLGGIPFLTNGVDYPQVWNPTSLSQKLVDLPNWPANTYCRVLRVYKNYMVALDITASGTRYNRMVKWSNPAEPGLLPDSWNPALPANDAGETVLSEGIGSLMDCATLGDVNILYLDSSTWGMKYSGGTFIFDFFKIFDTIGLLAPECVGSFKNSHFAVTQDDVVVHDGASAESVISGRMKRWFFNNLNSSAFFITKVVPFYRNQELWICFPKDSGVLDTALIWNWGTNAWSIRDLPNARAISSSLYTPGYSFDLWDTGDTLTWDEESTQPWGDVLNTRFVEDVLAAPPDLTGILKVSGVTRSFNGTSYRSFVERTDLCYTSMQEGKPVTNPNSLKNSVSFWPRIEAALGTELLIYIGSQQHAGGRVTWDGPHSFIVGTHNKIDSYISGRFWAFRIEESNNVDWKFTGYDAELSEVSLH